MRTVLKHILVLSAAAFAIIACKREIETERPVSGRMETIDVDVIAATTGEALPVKTYLGAYEEVSRAVLWGSGEQMQLAITSGGSTSFAKSSATNSYEGQPEATFSFSISPATASSYLYQGIYPACAVEELDNENTACYKVVLPTEQYAVAGRYDPDAYIMVAKPTTFDSKQSEWKASFRRAVALNKLILMGIPSGKSIKQVEIVAPLEVDLTGGREIDLTTGESGAAYSGCPRVEINYSDPLPGGADMEVWFTSWGAEMGAGQTFTVTAYTTDSQSYSKMVTIPSEHPVSLLEGYLNILRVSLEGVSPQTCYFSGGNGSSLNPWHIATVDDLMQLSNRVNSGDEMFCSAYYKQVADIDFAGKTLQAIGNSNESGATRFFTGSYKAGGFKIKNVSIDNSEYKKAVGFFGYLAGNAHIDGLYLEDPKVQAHETYNVGAVVGNIEGSSTVVVENCTVTGATVSVSKTSSVSGWHVGGIAGQQMSGVIRNCEFSGSVRSITNNKAGGIVGHMSGGSIIGCSVTGANTLIEVANDYAGGIVALADGTSGTKRIENCVVDCKGITATKGYVGGIVGDWGGGDGVIDGCTVAADITNNSAGSDKYGNIGGIVGYIANSAYTVVVSNCCYAGGNICNYNGTGGSVGGIAGGANSSDLNQKIIFNCCAFPDKLLSGSGTKNLGGIVGWAKNLTIRNCYCPTPESAFFFDGAPVTSGMECGGIYGWYSSSGIVQDAYWLSGFKVGKGTASPNSNQGLADSQMRNSGAVTRPSTGQLYSDFVSALNAGAAEWNEAPVEEIFARNWEINVNGYPVPKGAASASGSGQGSSGTSILDLCNDKIAEYGRQAVPANHIYICAHRGITYWSRQNQYPENCVPTIQKAIDLGADMVEIDVRTTKDGKLAVVHDESIKPVTNCNLSGSNAYIQNMTLATAQSFNMRMRGGSTYPKVNGQYIHIPTLEQVLQACKDKIYVTIHIKEADMGAVIDVIRSTGTVDQVCIFGASDKKAYVAAALEQLGRPLAIQPWLDQPSDVTTYQPSYFGCCKLFQYDPVTYYNKTVEGFGKQVHAYGALSFSNALDEDKNGIDWENQLITWYGNQDGACTALDRFIESGSDFLQVDFFEIADAYFKKKGLR